MPAFFIYSAIMYPHANIAITIITKTIFCFVNAGQPKLSPLLKYPSNIPIENSNVKPIIIGIPIFFNPSTTLSEPASFPDDIAFHPYFANINPAQINANMRNVLNTPCNCVINAHNPW